MQEVPLEEAQACSGSYEIIANCTRLVGPEAVSTARLEDG